MTNKLYTKPIRKKKKIGKINEASHDKMLEAMAGICEIIGLKRSAFFSKQVASDVYPKLFMTASLDHLQNCTLPLTPNDIAGAFKNASRHTVGFDAATSLEDVHRNAAISFVQDKELGKFLNKESDGVIPPEGENLFVLADINYASAYGMKFFKRNLVIELATICAVKAEILEFIKEAPDQTQPKVMTYNTIAKGLYPLWIRHDLSLPDLTEEKLNNPEWVDQQIGTLRHAAVGLIKCIDKKDRPAATKIIGYGPTITKNWAKDLAPKAVCD